MDGIEKNCQDAYKKFHSYDAYLKFKQLISDLENYAHERFHGWDSELGECTDDCIGDDDLSIPNCMPAEAAIFIANAHLVEAEKDLKESDEALMSLLPTLIKERVVMIEKFQNGDIFSKAILLNLLAKAHYTTVDALSKKSEPFRTELLKSIQPMMDEIQVILDAYKIPNPLAE